MAMTLSVGMERTGSEERVCRIRPCLEGYLNDVSMLRTRREGFVSIAFVLNALISLPASLPYELDLDNCTTASLDVPYVWLTIERTDIDID